MEDSNQPAQANSSAEGNACDLALTDNERGRRDHQEEPHHDQLHGQIDPVPGQLEPIPLRCGLLPLALCSNTESLITFY